MGTAEWVVTVVLGIPLAVLLVWFCRTIPGNWRRQIMAATDHKAMTDREAEEKIRAIVEELDRPTLALLYKTLHDALGFRIETADIAIAKLGG
jgi:hypothetical protein